MSLSIRSFVAYSPELDYVQYIRIRPYSCETLSDIQTNRHTGRKTDQNSLPSHTSRGVRVITYRRAARRGQGGRLTTLNFRPGAVTTLNLGHISIFLSCNISRKQTRQYRKSTKEATSGNDAKERQKQKIAAKNS